VDVDGLEPDRWYFYRFRTGQATSAVGRTRTAPAAGATTPRDSRSRPARATKPAITRRHEHLSREDVDLVAFLGDYIYEYAPGRNAVRPHSSLEVWNLDGYRGRYAQYKSDPALQAAHAARPWVAIADDHEVDNNYAGLSGENDFESVEWMRTRRAAAYQAWWENQPVRTPRANSWADLVMMRRVDWGSLARLHMLDGRQYRSNQACGDGTRKCRARLGRSQAHDARDAQEKWLSNGLIDVEAALAGAGQPGDDRAVRDEVAGREAHVRHGQLGRVSGGESAFAQLDRDVRAESHGGDHGRHSLELGERAALDVRGATTGR